MAEVAAEFNYIGHANSSFVWYFIEQSDIKGTALNRYEDDSSILPLSVMGLGSSSRSRVNGYARYAQSHRLLDSFDPEEKIYLGQKMDKQNEMVRTILTSLRNKWRVSLSKFRSKFGDDLLDEFRCVVDDLQKQGRVRVDQGYLDLMSKEPRDAMLTGMRFVGRETIESAFRDVLSGTPDAGDGGAALNIEPERRESGLGAEAVFSIHIGGAENAEVPALHRALSEAYAEGARSLAFVGGDPSNFPPLIDAIVFARETGMTDVSVCLDGGGWADRGFLEKLIDAGTTRFWAVLHGISESAERSVTGRDDFEKKMRGIGILNAMRLTDRLASGAVLHAAIGSANSSGLEAYVEKFLSDGFRDFRFHFPGPFFDMRLNRDTVGDYAGVMKTVLRLMLRNEEEWKANLSFAGVPPCMLRLGAEVSLSPKMTHHLAKRYLSEPEEWISAGTLRLRLGSKNDPKSKKVKKFIGNCNGCTFLGTCEGVWQYYTDFHGAKEIEPVTN
jgi:hypothetical protein